MTTGGEFSHLTGIKHAKNISDEQKGNKERNRFHTI